MLSYFRYFSVISFILVLLGAFSAGIYFRSLVADSVIRQPVELSNSKIAEYFHKNVWCRYVPVFRQLETQEIRMWKYDKFFQLFVRNSNTLLGILPAAQVNLRSHTGELIFSNSENVLEFDDNEEAGQQGIYYASKQTTFSRVVSTMQVENDKRQLKKHYYVRTIAPLDAKLCPSEGPAQPSGTPETATAPKAMLEILYDITTSWSNLYFFQIVVSSGIVVTFLILYLFLFITSRRAEKIINKQHEENLALTQAKATAEARSKEKSMFLANVSHELRTPLNAIIGFSEIIKDEVMGPLNNQQYKEYINDINASGVHLLSLINDILDYSKAEASKLELEAIDVDLTKLAQSCMRLVEPRARDAKVKLICQLPEQHVILTADPKRLKQVILNLLSNSVKFTPEDGEVVLKVTVDTLENLVKIIVRDTGIGIAPKDISKAMSPFGQVDSALSRRYEGTGLGLPLTKKLTEIMGGLFDIQSEVGLGTTVTLTFHLTQPHKEIKDEKQF